MSAGFFIPERTDMKTTKPVNAQPQLLRRSNQTTVSPQSMKHTPGTVRGAKPSIPVTGSKAASTKAPKPFLLR